METRAYHAEDFEEVRFQFLRSYRNPKVSLGGVWHIRKLTYTFSSNDGGIKGVCTVHRISKDAEANSTNAWGQASDTREKGYPTPQGRQSSQSCAPSGSSCPLVVRSPCTRSRGRVPTLQGAIPYPEIVM